MRAAIVRATRQLTLSLLQADVAYRHSGWSLSSVDYIVTAQTTPLDDPTEGIIDRKTKWKLRDYIGLSSIECIRFRQLDKVVDRKIDGTFTNAEYIECLLRMYPTSKVLHLYRLLLPFEIRGMKRAFVFDYKNHFMKYIVQLMSVGDWDETIPKDSTSLRLITCMLAAGVQLLDGDHDIGFNLNGCVCMLRLDALIQRLTLPGFSIEEDLDVAFSCSPVARSPFEMYIENQRLKRFLDTRRTLPE